jgi:hypothetical protein
LGFSSVLTAALVFFEGFLFFLAGSSLPSAAAVSEAVALPYTSFKILVSLTEI